jgi:NAD(P)-dependent dehydrogenase (short-subunit alcohol dehydrogenase family)
MLATRTKASIDSVTRTLNHLAPTVQTLAVDTDVSSPDQVDHLFRLTVEQFERVDVVVHCAGVLGPLEKIGDADPGPWFEAFVRLSSNHHEPMTACLHLLCVVQNINAKGTFLVARALIRAAKGADATFIHARTAASYLASPGQSAYTASKAADNMIVDQLHIGMYSSDLYKVSLSAVSLP